MLHFVGFKGVEFHRAAKVFGPPDYIHRRHDVRMYGEVAPEDVIVFANGAEKTCSLFAFNDSEYF